MNPQNRKQFIMAAALGAVLVGVLVYQFVFAGGTKPPPPPKANTTAAGAAKPAAVKPSSPAGGPTGKMAAASEKQGATSLDSLGMDIDQLLDDLLKEVQVVSFDYQAAASDRDPMTPLVGYIQTGQAITPTETAGSPIPFPLLQKKVSAILWDQYNPVAVVDDEVVAAGHVYPGGIQIQAIERDRVIFKINDALVPIELKEQ